MKNITLCGCLIFISSLSGYAQTGDFNLNNNASTKRTYVTQAADSTLKGGMLKYIVVGRNYRKEWLQPVTTPVVNLQTDFGGLKPDKEGGGKQTRNLRMIDASGREWALRSVRKYPEAVVDPALKGTIAERIIKDGISASYPYSALTVGTFSKAAGVPYMQNTLVVIPDDPALGKFRETYKNQLSLMELRTITHNGKEAKTENTDEVVESLMKSGMNTLDQRKVLRARLLDNFVMDFDRHADQWEWVEIESDDEKSKYYYPVPKDRDQAFFDINGFVAQLLSRVQPTLGVLQGIRPKARNIKTFNHTAKDFDRVFLTQLDESTWSAEIDTFLSAMTDEVIESALLKQPKEVHQYHVQEITRILKKKRQYFKEDMMKYYRFLARIVTIPGTNHKNTFTITTNPDRTLSVHVQEMGKDGAPAVTTYQRTFHPEVTKELRLYGLEDDDEFLITGGESGIKVRMIGGPGNDTFNNAGTGGNLLAYDVSFENNEITGNSGIKNKINDDYLNNEYQRLGMHYNQTLPWIAAEITREGGLFLGPTLKFVRHGFRKEPYSEMHFLYATRALNSNSYHFRYDADYMQIGKNLDLVFRSDATLPTVRTYFFGLGNNTINDQSRDLSYYLASYNLVDLSLLARLTATPWLQFSAGPVGQYLQLKQDRNKGNFVQSVYPGGTASSSLYQGAWYMGGELRAAINTRNHPVLATRGIKSNLYTRALSGMGNLNNSFQQVGGNLSLLTDFLFKQVVVLGTSVGVDHTMGNFEFPQAQYLGWRSNLRGYRFQRFAGRTRMYNNNEVRINLGQVNLYFFKGYAGLLGFYDIGRVWMDNENSDVLHKGYGGGVWVAPFNKLVMTGTVVNSSEEKNWLQVGFGFQF